MRECLATIESSTMSCHILYFAVSFDIPEGTNWIKAMRECLATIESTTMLCHILYFAVSFDIPDANNWIKGNAGMYGYNRVNYDVMSYFIFCSKFRHTRGHQLD